VTQPRGAEAPSPPWRSVQWRLWGASEARGRSIWCLGLSGGLIIHCDIRGGSRLLKTKEATEETFLLALGSVCCAIRSQSCRGGSGGSARDDTVSNLLTQPFHSFVDSDASRKYSLLNIWSKSYQVKDSNKHMGAKERGFGYGNDGFGWHVCPCDP
jgi:hypothetical protein